MDRPHGMYEKIPGGMFLVLALGVVAWAFIIWGIIWIITNL